jgi:hypothetical protein
MMTGGTSGLFEHEMIHIQRSVEATTGSRNQQTFSLPLRLRNRIRAISFQLHEGE